MCELAGPRLLPWEPLNPPPPPAWTLSPPNPAWCCCTRLCFRWPRMMWQCHVSSSECRCYRLNGFSLLKRFPLSADGACGKALDQPVGEWLEHVGLPQYESKFLLNGFDDLRFMVSHLPHIIPQGSLPLCITLASACLPACDGPVALVFGCHHSAHLPSACLSVTSSPFFFSSPPLSLLSLNPLL